MGLDDDEEKQRLRQRFLRYADKLAKTEPKMAEQIREKVNALVEWYFIHNRDMTPKEFEKLLTTGLEK